MNAMKRGTQDDENAYYAERNLQTIKTGLTFDVLGLGAYFVGDEIVDDTEAGLSELLGDFASVMRLRLVYDVHQIRDPGEDVLEEKDGPDAIFRRGRCLALGPRNQPRQNRLQLVEFPDTIG